MSRPGIDQRIFWGHVEKSTDPDGCWMWAGPSSKPFPNAAVYGKYHGTVAHRIAYGLVIGPIPEGLHLDHLCLVTLCVNPAHLEPVTREENNRRRWALRTHCNQGHELTPDNCIGDSKRCATCDRARSLAYYYRVRRVPLHGDRLARECKNGHPRTEENTYLSPAGHRQCRDCRRATNAQFRARKAGVAA